MTIRQALEVILEAADYENASVEYDANKPSMFPKRIIDISLARQKLGFDPKIQFKKGFIIQFSGILNNRDKSPEEL